jgi:hypothetical protein
MTPPRWSRAVVGLLGAVVVALGVLCFAAPTALFGPDSYRIPVRVSIGLLGAVAGGLGVAALLAAAIGTSDTLRTMSSALLVVTTIAPAVVLYNIGYFDTVATSGVRALSLSVGIVVGAGVPLILNLRVLHRIRSQPAGSMEQEPALRHADEVTSRSERRTGHEFQSGSRSDPRPERPWTSAAAAGRPRAGCAWCPSGSYSWSCSRSPCYEGGTGPGGRTGRWYARCRPGDRARRPSVAREHCTTQCRRPEVRILVQVAGMCCDIRRHQERSEQPHFRGLLDCVA